MKKAAALSKQALEAVVSGIQAVLYCDFDAPGQDARVTGGNLAGEKPCWNPDKEWKGADTLQEIADVLTDHGLVPESSDSV